MQLFVKDLTVIDASYLCPQRGMVGESWIVDVVLTGGLDQQSMVLDFGLVKKRLKQLIDEEVDHKLLVPAQHESVTAECKSDERLFLTMTTEQGVIAIHSPAQGIAMLPAQAVTTQSVTEYLVELSMAVLPDNVAKMELTLREEVIPTAFYHYSHGLKKHDGNCQRIAHGHRSMIEIFHQGARDDSLEKSWAKRWQDIYLGSVEDLSPLVQLELAQGNAALSDETHFGFRYEAAQGLFELAMPKKSVELIDSDTTVELLAEYILQQVKQEHQLSGPVVVHAYEGVGKGAIAKDD